MQRKTGARGLRTILENVLLETMYELPAHAQTVQKVVVDEAGDSRREQAVRSVWHARRRDDSPLVERAAVRQAANHHWSKSLHPLPRSRAPMRRPSSFVAMKLQKTLNSRANRQSRSKLRAFAAGQQLGRFRYFSNSRSSH
jgi:hypothetical protein